MSSYQNPFRLRTSEQQRDLLGFLRTFGVGILELLPETLWDRPLLIRSAPGGGKTSLMRVFTVESLQQVHTRKSDLELLSQRLTELGALNDEGPTTLGVRIPLDRDYRSINDFGMPPESADRIFLRLLNARVISAVIRSALAAANLRYPADVRRLFLTPAEDAQDESDAMERLGGPAAHDLLADALNVEARILSLADSLLPIDHADLELGHNDLYSLRALSDVSIRTESGRIAMRPLVMFDDGHELGSSQRVTLLERLLSRSLTVPRWYSERLEALDPQDLLTGDVSGRDYDALEIETATRPQPGRGRTKLRFDRLVQDIGNRRAAPTLMRYGEHHRSFGELLDIDTGTLAASADSSLLDLLEEETTATAVRGRHDAWLAEARRLKGYEAAIKWREVRILIAKDNDRSNLELFEFELDESDADRLSGSAIREAAALFLAREHRVPYYWGSERLAKLSSQNIEQYLTVSGELFEEMLSLMALNRSPELPGYRQDAIVRQYSERFWRSIPRLLPHGRDVQRVLIAVASLARRDTFRETAPYAPGVTGTAMTMTDRDHLLDETWRRKTPGAERLFDALGSAIAYNVLSAELDRSVKGDRFMVLYLNRLLCARFGLPLGRGGFRERRVEAMANWILDPRFEPVDETAMELPLEWGG